MSLIGRPRVLDDGKRREICALVCSGLELADAAQCVGCSLRTVRRETARNDDFRRQLSQARLAGRIDPVHHLRYAALTDWRAAAWLLERTNPGQFARRDRGGCGSQDLQTVVERIIETSLIAIDDQDTRSRVFRAASSVGRCALESLFPPQRLHRPQLERGLTPLHDREALAEHLEQLSAPARDAPWARRAAELLELTKPATENDKSPAPPDKTPAPTDKTSSGAARPVDAPSPQHSGAGAQSPPHGRGAF
jgi:hypothetical protein